LEPNIIIERYDVQGEEVGILHRRTRIKKSRIITMPKIPKTFIENPTIRQALYLTINDFNFEEQAVIYLYCFIELSIREIVILTELSTLHVVGSLILYSERLGFKVNVFKTAAKCNILDLVPVIEMFETEHNLDFLVTGREC